MAKLLTGTRIYGTATVDTILYVNSTTNASSTTTGALQVIGGAGIGGNLYVGGTVNAGSLVGVITTATNLAGGASGSLPYQSGVGATTFVSIGSSGTILTSNGSAPTWVSASSLVAGNATTSTNIAGGTAGQTPYQTAPGITSFYGPGTDGDVLVSRGTSGPTYQNTLTLAGTAQATSTQTGVLQVRGGAGIGLDLFVGNNLNVDGNLYVDGTINAVTFNGTATNADNIKTVQRSISASHYLTFVDSDNATAGYEALYTDAGISYNPSTNDLSVSNNITVGGDLAINGGDITSTAGTFNLVNSGVTALNLAGAGTAVTVGSTTGYTAIRNATTVTNGAVSTSTNTGALVVYGGVGVGGSVYATGGQFNSVRVGITAAGEIDTTSGNLTLDSAGGTVNIDDNLIIAGNLTVQGTTTIVDSTVTNVADPIFSIGTGANGGNPGTDDNKDRGIQFFWHNGTNARAGFFGYDDSTGFFTFLSSATFINDVVAPDGGTTRGAVDVNLAYGAAGSIPYQDAPNSTTFLPLGSNGFVLTAGASAPQWSSVGSIGVGTAATVDTVGTATNAVHYLTFVNSNNASPGAELVYTTSTLQVNPFTGNFGVGQTGAPASKFQVAGDARISGITTVTNGTFVASTATGAFQVVGGVGVGGGLFVGGIVTASNSVILTSTTPNANTTNSGVLQVVGGIGVGGGARFGNAVTATIFSAGGTASNDVVITQSQIYRSGGSLSITAGAASAPSITGGAGLLAGNLGPLDLYSGASGNINLRTSTYGQTVVVSSSATLSTLTGALQVVGGLGVGGGGFFGGTVTATSFVGSFSGSITGVATSATNLAGGASGSIPIQSAAGSTAFIPIGSSGFVLQSNGTTATWVSTSSIFSGFANTSTNLQGGTAGQVPYQSGVSATAFTGPGTAGEILVSRGTTGPVFQNTLTLAGTTWASNTSTGALQVRGGAGIGGNLWVGDEADILGRLDVTGISTFANLTTVTNTTNASSTITGALQIRGGAGIGGNLYVGQNVYATTFVGNISGQVTGTATTATNIAGGTAGQLPYQTGAGATSFTGPGTAGQLLQSQGTNAPTYVSTASLHVQTSTYAINLLYGAAGSLPYQSAAGTTAMLAIGGNGLVLTSNGSNPTWAAAGSLAAGNATTATNLAGGTAGQVPYQTGAGATSFYGPGTSGQLLISQGTGAPNYVNTATFMVGRATSAINVLYGAAGSLHYQSAADTTAMLGIGTAGQVLTVNAGATAPQWVSTASIYAGTAVNADNIRTLGINTNASYYPIFVDSNNASSAYEATYSSSGLSVNPSTNHFTAGAFIPTSTTLVNNGIYAGASSSIVVGISGQPRLTIDGSGSGFVRVDNALAATSTATGALRVIGGAGIGGDLYAANIYSNGTRLYPLNIQEFSATAGQTSFTISGGYTVGTVQVFANGIALNNQDYTASNGSTVVVNYSRKAGDLIRVVSGGTSSSQNQQANFAVAMSVAMAM